MTPVIGTTRKNNGENMVSLADYFAANRHKAKYNIGDRVFGKWNKIPFVGSIGNDGLVNETDGPQLTIILDLPIKYQKSVHTVIIVKHKDVKLLEIIAEEKSSKVQKNVIKRKS